jgi:hypothetical protein
VGAGAGSTPYVFRYPVAGGPGPARAPSPVTAGAAIMSFARKNEERSKCPITPSAPDPGENTRIPARSVTDNLRLLDGAIIPDASALEGLEECGSRYPLFESVFGTNLFARYTPLLIPIKVR